MKLIYALCGLLLANAAWAMPDMEVESIRMPAWVEHGARHRPLAVGMELASGDVVVTGPGSRVLLKSGAGSDVRLGENARFVLSALGWQHGEHPRFTATFEASRGVIRFTAGSGRHDRAITLKIAGTTVTTQDADLWGRAGKDGNGMLLLVSGHAVAAPATGAPLALDQPLTSVVMTKGAAPLPMSGTGEKRVAKLMQETAIEAGQGAVRNGGRWKVNLMVKKGQVATLKAYDELRAAGYDVRILPLSGGRYRLRIIQLADRAEARALAQNLSGKMGIVAPAVSR